MSKVTVEVVADTRPFLRSIAKLRRIAAQLNNVNYQNSNKLLKNLYANHKLNEKITREVQKQNKEYAKSNKLIAGTLSGLGKIAAVGAVFTGLKSLVSTGYKTGQSIFNAAATYGGNPNEVVRARGLIARGGGTPEEGEALYSQYMQNRMLFEKYQQGGFKEAATRFRIDPRVLLTENLEGLINNLRQLSQQRGYDSNTKQAILQQIGLGNNAAIMNLLNMSNEEYAKNVGEVNEQLEESRIEWEKQLKLQQEWNKTMDNFKQQLMKLAQALTPVLEWFNKLPDAMKWVVLAGTLGGGNSLLRMGGSLLGKGIGLAGSGVEAAGSMIAKGAGSFLAAPTGVFSVGGGLGLLGIGAAVATIAHDVTSLANGEAADMWTYKLINGIWHLFDDPENWGEKQKRKMDAWKQSEEFKQIMIRIESGDSVGREVGNALYDELQMSPVTADVNLR